MTKLNGLLCFCALGAVSAVAQIPIFQQTTVPLTGSTPDNIFVLTTQYASGTVKQVNCTVTTAVTGAPVVDLFVGPDDGSSGGVGDISTYSGSNTWNSPALPFQVMGSTSSPGANVGDSFAVPLNLKFNYYIQIHFLITTAATAGELTCTVGYTT